VSDKGNNMTALTIQDHVYSVEKDFNQVNNYKLNFAKESGFALQLLSGNDYLLKAAKANPEALEYALINLASIGISLNPALKESYLVPRGGKICLDISYMGLIKLATDTGSVVWVQAEIVKAKDTFTYNGVGQAPTHNMNPFSDRGDVIGVYAVAKLSSGEFLSTIMSKADCDAIRDKSSQAAQSGPWKTFYEEMLKKTVIKRASKLWPKSERLDTAVEVLNQHEGIDFTSSKGAFIAQPSDDIVSNDKTFKNIRDLLDFNKKTEIGLLIYINKKFKTEFESIENFEPVHIEEAYRAMGGKK
jgi:recombination protein RecT